MFRALKFGLKHPFTVAGATRRVIERSP